MINKTDKTLDRLNKKKERKLKLPILKTERVSISIDPIDIKRMTDNYEKLYPHKFDNLGEINKYLKDTNCQNHSRRNR